MTAPQTTGTPAATHVIGRSASAFRAATAGAVVVPGAKRWWVETFDGGVELHGDVPAGGGPWAPETRLAAGAGLFTVHLEVVVHEVRPVTTLLPRSGRASLLALTRYGAEAPPTPTERTLHAVLTGARPPAHVDLPEIRPFLRRAAEAEASWVRSAVDPAERAALRALLVRADGIDPDAVLVLVASTHDLPASQLRAGRAVQRVLLTAAALGYPGALVAGRGGLDLSRRALLTAGLRTGAVPQAVLAIDPRA